MLCGVTGATGVLGGRLVEILVQKGFQVRCLVRNVDKATTLSKQGVDLVQGDLSNADALKEFVLNLDVCFHLAAQVSHSDWNGYYRSNVEGTQNLIEAIIDHNPGARFVYSSTISALRFNPRREYMSTEYARSKYLADLVVEKYMSDGKIRGVIVYPGMIYGVHDLNFVPTIAKLLRQKKLFLVTGGESGAPLIYIDDLCELFILSATKEEAVGKKYISVKGLEIGVHGFIQMIAKRIGEEGSLRKYPKSLLMPLAILNEILHKVIPWKKNPFLSMRIVDILSLSFSKDYELATRDLGWTHKISLDEGLDRAFSWYEEKGFHL